MATGAAQAVEGAQAGGWRRDHGRQVVCVRQECVCGGGERERVCECESVYPLAALEIPDPFADD